MIRRPPWAAGSGGLLVLLVVIDLGELRIDDVFLRPAGAAARAAVTTLTAARTLLGLPVHGLAELHRRLHQGVGLGLDGLGIVALHGFLEIGHRVLDRAALVLADLGAMLGQRLLGRVDQGLSVVLRLDLRLALLVLVGMRFGILDHALDVGLGEAARRLDADLLLLVGRLVLGRD